MEHANFKLTENTNNHTVKSVNNLGVSNLVQIRSKMAELLPFNGFQKMAAAAILNLLPVSIFSIWSSLGSGCECSCKISYVYVNIGKKK